MVCVNWILFSIKTEGWNKTQLCTLLFMGVFCELSKNWELEPTHSVHLVFVCVFAVCLYHLTASVFRMRFGDNFKRKTPESVSCFCVCVCLRFAHLTIEKWPNKTPEQTQSVFVFYGLSAHFTIE